MRALKYFGFTCAATLVSVSLLLGEAPPPQTEKPASVTDGSDGSNSLIETTKPGGLSDVKTARAERSSQKSDGLLLDRGQIQSVAELEGAVAVLQDKCAGLEQRLMHSVDQIQELQARLEKLEDRDSKTLSQVTHIQVAQKERKLNPTEQKQTADLIQQRIRTAQNQWLRAWRIQESQSNNLAPRHEEPLYSN